jgi:two-component system, OmpR family, phosphate regulon response regulator PhoB
MTAAKDVKVLVVDDNALVLGLLMKGLSQHCDAHAAADGADALLKIIDEQPDLVVCDYRMPGLDGRQLFEKTRGRSQTKNIPFIFLASRGDIEEKLRPIVDGVEEFISKPFFINDFLQRAKKVIDRLQLEKLQ